MIRRNIKRAVITGPTGTIGTALCQKLIDEGIETYAIVRPDSKRIEGIPNGVNIIRCDASELANLKLMINEADAFFHLAWAHTIGPGRNDMPSQIKNIQYSIDAVHAASELGCKIFIGAGSQAECGRVEGLIKPDTPCFPETGYGMAKLCAGQMTRVECEKFGIEHVWIRVLSIYGPNDGPATMISTTIRKLLNGEKPALTKGEQMWDYLYSKDVANGFFCAAVSGKNNAVYPLGSGQARPLREYVEILRDVIDHGLPIGFGELDYSPNQVMFLQADISSLQYDTGYNPNYSFEDGIKETIGYVLGHLQF